MIKAPATPGHAFRFKHKLFSLDASLIDASLKIFPWANYNNMKAVFKLHVELDHEGLIPAFASLTQGKVSDMTQARLFQFPKGSVAAVAGTHDFVIIDQQDVQLVPVTHVMFRPRHAAVS